METRTGNRLRPPRAGMRRRLLRCALALLVATAPPLVQAAEPSEALVACEQTVHADAQRALAMAAELLTPLDPERDVGAWHEALGCRAWAHAVAGERDAALADAERMASAVIADAATQVRVLRRAASVQQELGRAEPAVQLLGQALAIAEREQLGGLQIEVMTNLAVLHSQAQQHDIAIGHLERALAQVIATGDRRREMPVRFNLGQSLRGAGRNAEAAAMFDTLVPALEAPGLESRLASLLGALGWLHVELGETDVAGRHFARAVALHEGFDNAAELTVVLNGQARIALDRGDVEAATPIAVRALDAARRAGDGTSLVSALDINVELAERQGRHANALALYRERSARAIEQVREQQRSRLNELEVELGLVRQARELDQLKQRSELQTLELARQRNTLMLAALLGLAAVLALVWQRTVNRRLHRLSRTDQLTGLLNRRGLIEAMEVPFEAGAQRLVLLVDIDHFKQINDRHGHAAGDRVLGAVAHAIEATAATHDAQAARWGGEEFAVLATAADGAAALRLAGTLGRAVGAVSVAADDGTPINVAVSVGFAPVFADAADRPGWQHTLRVADALLYRAKHAGRGRSAGAWPIGAGSAPPVAVAAVEREPGWQLLEQQHRPAAPPA